MHGKQNSIFEEVITDREQILILLTTFFQSKTSVNLLWNEIRFSAQRQRLQYLNKVGRHYFFGIEWTFKAMIFYLQKVHVQKTLHKQGRRVVNTR